MQEHTLVDVSAEQQRRPQQHYRRWTSVALTVVVPKHGLVVAFGQDLTPDGHLTSLIGDEDYVQRRPCCLCSASYISIQTEHILFAVVRRVHAFAAAGHLTPTIMRRSRKKRQRDER